MNLAPLLKENVNFSSLFTKMLLSPPRDKSRNFCQGGQDLKVKIKVKIKIFIKMLLLRFEH